MIEIDGSYGEGGGQILRTALTLSMLTQIPIRIENIRAKRKKAGLLRQHLTCVQAAQVISQAEVQGDALGSTTLMFTPKTLQGGDFTFDIGSAGSCTLVLQTVLLALASAQAPSKVRLRGGTHNPLAPSATFLQHAYLPLLAKMGLQADLSLDRYGFFPAGGGDLTLSVQPMRQAWQPLHLLAKGDRVDAFAQSLVAAVPVDVAKRELSTVGKKMGWGDAQLRIQPLSRDQGPGNVLELILAHQHCTEVFYAFGERGKTAEQVANEVCRNALSYLASGAAIGEYLADQLLLPLALAGEGSFTCAIASEHLRTNAAIIENFLPVDIQIKTSPEGYTVTV